ncbi:MAG: hypothetical protein ACLFR6_04265 [Salinarchaeum sp.]
MSARSERLLDSTGRLTLVFIVLGLLAWYVTGRLVDSEPIQIGVLLFIGVALPLAISTRRNAE